MRTACRCSALSIAACSLTTLLASLWQTLVLAAPVADEVLSLPGWHGPLPSKQYSGFLDVSPTAHLHYVFVEASSDSPETAPVVLWLNGGPGASSFGYGYLTELGPFWLQDNVTESTRSGRQSSVHDMATQLRANPTAWTSVANVLFLESPNVGFSYCGPASREGKLATQTCSWTDTSTAALNFGALKLFYSKFPEYKSNPFWIWGESYAGIYIPMLADLIVNATAHVSRPQVVGYAPVPQLQGIGVGNGCLGDKVGRCSPQGTRIEVEFLYGHGAISQPTYEALKVECPDFTNPTKTCNDWLDKMSVEAGPYYAYNLYDDCGPNGQVDRDHFHRTWREHQVAKSRFDHVGTAPPTTNRAEPPHHAHVDFGYPCGKQAAASKWLDDPEVRQALHVPPVSFYGYNFHLDQIEPPFNYTSDVDSLVPTYLRLIPKSKVLIYNGDVDPCVPYNGNEEWTRGLGLNVTSNWSPWYSDPGTGSQIAGYTTVYDYNFTFMTVKGAGHMVPQYQPQRALDMFARWVGVRLPDTGSSSAHIAANPEVIRAIEVATERAPKHRANDVGSSRAADEVTTLPGWRGSLPSRQFSGYLDIGLATGAKENIHIHYWLSESEGDPATDPIVFWMNGGPGGSSLIGGLTENGPFYLDDTSFLNEQFNATGIPTVYHRNYRWNKIANMVYVETPAMTGFSYCDDDCAWDDETTADAHYQMTLAFFDAFPEYKERDLYFTGESCLYIPMVSDRILNNTVEAKAHGVNLAGFMIGNGCPGWNVLTCTPYSCGHTGGICTGGGTEVAVNFRYGNVNKLETTTDVRHALASQPTYAQYLALCGDQRWDDPSPACVAAINDFTDETGTGGLAGSTYNIYDMCGSDGANVRSGSANKRHDGATGAYAHLNDAGLAALAGFGPQELAEQRATIAKAQGKVGDHHDGQGGLNNFPCGEDQGMTYWLNLPAVQKALHVTAAHRRDGRWSPSSGLNYTHTAPTLLHLYPRLIDKLRILLFSGDVDECVPYNGAEQWTRGFGYKEQEHWRPWMADGQVAGYATIYDTPKNFTFATVRGAGHMAPYFQPLRVFSLFERFLASKKP